MTESKVMRVYKMVKITILISRTSLVYFLNHLLLPTPHFVCPLFHFKISQNIVLFLKIKVINLQGSSHMM